MPTATLTPPGMLLPDLNAEMLSGDPMTAAIAAEKIAEYKESFGKDFITTVCDRFWVPTGELGDDMMELSAADPRNKLGSATLKVKGNSEFIAQFMGCTDTLVGITVETAGMRMAYYLKSFDYEFKNGEWIGTANLLSIWDILNFMQIWPNFLLPLEVQIPSYAIFIWALCTVVESMVGECAFRIQSGIYTFINNAGSLDPDWRTWFSDLLESDGNIFEMLKTPIYVVHHNPLTDTSPLVARTVRMESCGTVIMDVTKAYGVDCRMDLWLPGDEQPDAWANLDQPTYVFSATDRSQIEGPTGTVLDSVLRTVVDAGGSFFGSIPGIVSTVPGMDDVFIAPILGVDYVAPWAVLIAPDPPQKGSVVDCKLSFHTMQGHTHIVGGQSPKWLNDLMNATFSWLIDSISILIGVTGIPSNLLEGFLNNAFLAFQQVQDFDRRTKAGPYHPGVETFTSIQSGTYNIETIFAFINKLWDTRGYVSAQASFRNGEVYTLGKDVFRGGLMSVLYMNRTRLFTDYIEMVIFHVSPTARDVLVQIGDGKAEESPLAKHQRFITGIFESINVITLAPQGGS